MRYFYSFYFIFIFKYFPFIFILNLRVTVGILKTGIKCKNYGKLIKFSTIKLSVFKMIKDEISLKNFPQNSEDFFLLLCALSVQSLC